MNSEGLVWNKSIHHRFSRDDKRRILTILLVYQRTKFTHKDLLFAYIIPLSVKTLWIPRFYVTDLPFSLVTSEMEQVFNTRLEYAEIALRRNGKSMGFGYIECTYWDDYYNLITGKRIIVLEERRIVFVVERENDGF